MIPTIGDLLAAHPGVVADVAVLPSRGRCARGRLAQEARTLFVRPERAGG